MKSKIYNLMAESSRVVSGAQLSRSLGISRVAVWKHIQQMKQSGCGIEVTPKGYRLLHQPDRALAWVFGRRSENIHYFEEIGSTMTEAMALAGRDCPPFTVVVAERQKAGRGRLQRAWHSGNGGLYFTIVLRPELTAADAPLINLAAAVDLARLLIDHYGIPARVKWPNDVLVEGRKIAGILSQMGCESERVEFINLGIGINVNNCTDSIAPLAISMAQLIGRPVIRAALLEYFLDRFETRIADLRRDVVIDQWRRLSTTLGRCVTIQTLTETVSGIALDVEENGALIIETAPGERRTIVYGDCCHTTGLGASVSDDKGLGSRGS